MEGKQENNSHNRGGHEGKSRFVLCSSKNGMF